MILVMFLTFTFLFIVSKELFKSQVDIWREVVPKYTLPYLMASEYVPIESQLELIQAQNIFSRFYILNNRKKVISNTDTEVDTKSINPSEYELIPIKDGANVIWGYVMYKTNFFGFLKPFLWLSLILFCLIFVATCLIVHFLQKAINAEFVAFNTFIDKIHDVARMIVEMPGVEFDKVSLTNNGTKEYLIINQTIQFLLTHIKDAQNRIKVATEASELQKSSIKLARVAEQVAHDVRSPLAALKTLSTSLDELAESKKKVLRGVIGRIENITDTLTIKYTAINSIDHNMNMEVYKNLISDDVESIVEEKQLQFVNFKLIYEIDDKDKNTFSLYNPFEFKRVLSNLINNAKEAIKERGVVKLAVQSNGTNIEVNIIDNGKGINKTILPRLGEKGITYGKPNGTGLGLYHAKMCMENWGGSLSIRSKVGFGTTVKLTFPLTDKPWWYVDKIEISGCGTVIIIDDCATIHDTWDRKLQEIKGLKIIHLYTFKAAQKLLKNTKIDLNNTLFLVDYEIEDSDFNGIQFIQTVNLQKASILVTGRYNEIDILKNCELGKIKILPKPRISTIPVVGSKKQKTYDAILIDDDDIIRLTWQLSAEQCGLKLHTYANFNNFVHSEVKFNNDVQIYVDFDFNDELDGGGVCERLSKLGFKNISIVTGYNKYCFSKRQLQWPILNKIPPWDKELQG